MMSLHCVPYIPISRMKILYTDILPNYLSKFHKYGSYIFFPSGRPHLANHPLPLSAFVHFCLTPSPPKCVDILCGWPHTPTLMLSYETPILKSIYERMPLFV